MKRWLVVLLALVPAGFAFGAEAAPADLGALLQEALDNNPVLRAARERLQAARRRPSQARTRPDPEISIAYLNDGLSRFTLGESEFSTLSLTWTQEMPHPGKLPRMGEVAGFDAERAAKDLERARLEVCAAVKTAYADLYRLDRTGAILQETRSVLESLAQAARRRYEVGEGIQENVLKAQTEILRLDAEIARVTQDRRTAELRLDVAVGRDDDAPIGPARALPEGALPGHPEGLAEDAASASPEIGALEAAVRQEEAGVRLARLNLKPDFTWSASYQNRDGLDPMVMGSFGVRLPLYRQRKQAQALLEKESDLLAARQDLRASQVRTRASVGELVARVQRAERLLDLYSQGVIPQAKSALESAQSSYGAGRIAFLDLLNDLTTLLGARIELTVQESDRVQALAALEPLLVRQLIRVPGAREAQGDQRDENR